MIEFAKVENTANYLSFPFSDRERRSLKKKQKHLPTCHMWIGPRNPVNSHSASPYMNCSHGKMPFLWHFLWTWRSTRLKPQLDTWITASSINGFVLPWRIDSSTSLCQNSSKSDVLTRVVSYMNKKWFNILGIEMCQKAYIIVFWHPLMLEIKVQICSFSRPPTNKHKQKVFGATQYHDKNKNYFS